MIFQSTRPVWGATVGVLVIVPNAQQISIHAPRVGRDQTVPNLHSPPLISIHAPRVGRD